MLVVRLDNVLEDIIRYESETSGAEITKPVIEKLDWLEKKVDVELFAIRDGDGGGCIKGQKLVEKQRKVSSTIRNVCFEAIQTVPQHSEVSIRNMYKVNAILSLHDPFETFIKQAVEHTLHERTKPIMEILEMLEEKVEEYGKLAITVSDVTSMPNGENYYALPWHEEDTTKQNRDELSNDRDSNTEKLIDTKQKGSEHSNAGVSDTEKLTDTKKKGNKPLNDGVSNTEKSMNIQQSRNEVVKFNESNKDNLTEISKKKDEIQQDMSLVVSDKTVVENKVRNGMIVRITSWSYNTTTHPEADKIYLDLTKKRIELLVETNEDMDGL